MVLHGITLKECNSFQLFPLGEITGNYSITVTSNIAMSFIWIEFHHFMKIFKVVNNHVRKFEFYWFTNYLKNLNKLFLCVVVEYVIAELFFERKVALSLKLLYLVSIHPTFCLVLGVYNKKNIPCRFLFSIEIIHP